LYSKEEDIAFTSEQMTSFCLHGILLSRKAELDQFVLGLGPLVDIIKQHPKTMEPLFLAGSEKLLTAEEFLSLVEYDNVNDSLKQHFIRYVHLPGNNLLPNNVDNVICPYYMRDRTENTTANHHHD
jgi:hypothetical protein